MATHSIRSVGCSVLNHPMLSYWAQWEPEGASQTFTAGSPVVWSSGLLVAATSPIEADTPNKVTGLAIEDGHNAAAAASNRCKFVPAIDGVIFYANLLTGDGATYTITAADMGNFADNSGEALRSKSGLIDTGVTDWFLDNADNNGTMIVSFVPDITIANEDVTYVQVGHVDARVGFVFTPAVRTYGSPNLNRFTSAA